MFVGVTSGVTFNIHIIHSVTHKIMNIMTLCKSVIGIANICVYTEEVILNADVDDIYNVQAWVNIRKEITIKQRYIVIISRSLSHIFKI